MYSDIVVVGSLNMDMVIHVTQRPKVGETILGNDFFMSPGGKGANQAYAASLLGGSVSMIGCVGSDIFGFSLKKQLIKGGVNIEHIIEIKDVSTGVAFITLDKDGNNNIIVSPGANYRVTPELVREKEDIISKAKLLMVQLEIPLESVLEAVKIANKHQVPVLLDPAPAQQLPDELLQMVDYITPNEIEMYQLTGIEVTDTKSAQVAAVSLIEKGIKTVFAKMGEKGVTVVNSNRSYYVEGNKVEVVDTTAAGDSFSGAIGVALINGMNVWSAAHFGNAVAAIAVTRKGALTSMPTKEEVETFLEKSANGKDVI
jgi:ribokinase